MIGPTGAVRVMVATKPVDFRKGADGLAALVRESLAADPFSGAVYVFRAKRADRIKLVFWDGTGLCLFAKRLEDGIFRWPRVTTTTPEPWRCRNIHRPIVLTGELIRPQPEGVFS